MQDQQRLPQLSNEKNGKYPILPVYYGANIQDHKTDEWDLRYLLTVARRRAAVIGSVAIALAATVWCWTLTREAEYQGNFRLLVEPVTTADENQLAGLTELAGTETKLQETGLDYETQIEVLQSPELMAPIIKELSARYPDIQYDSLLENLGITRFKETKILKVSYQDSEPKKIQFVLQQLSKEFLKYSLQERQTNLRKGIEFVNAQLPQLQMRVNTLQKDLQKFRQHYNFIAPEVKAELLSEQANSFELQRLETQKQLAEARALYATLQGQSGATLAESLASGAVAPSQLGLQPFEQSTANPQPQSGAQITQTDLANQTSQAKTDSPESQAQAPVYQQLLTQLRELETQIGSDLTRFQEDSPAIERLRRKRENLLPVLQEEGTRVLENKRVEVANKIASLEMQAVQIAKAEDSLNQQTKQLPALVRQYTDLQRELTIATESLNRFLEKRQSLQIEIAQKEIPWEVIAAPNVAEEPVSPNVSRNLILGAVTGLLAGIGAALLVERLDNVFHSLDDLKEVTKLPLLGTVPFHKQMNSTSAISDETTVEKKSTGYKLKLRNTDYGESYFPFLESFRSLHTNINFLSSDSPIHSLVVTSAHKGDGKSTVASNLAQAAAALGQHVLLVDADLRLPQVHTRLNLPNEVGLSNAISENLPVLEIIQRSPLSENLFVLTSGPVPPDPVKLLSSMKMQNIMDNMQQLFDLVIYDTPPLMGLSDSSLLANHTDGIVLVVRMGNTDRSLVTQALEGLKLSRAAVLGVVCNGVKHQSKNAYNYDYYKSKIEQQKRTSNSKQ